MIPLESNPIGNRIRDNTSQYSCVGYFYLFLFSIENCCWRCFINGTTNN